MLLYCEHECRIPLSHAFEALAGAVTWEVRVYFIVGEGSVGQTQPWSMVDSGGNLGKHREDWSGDPLIFFSRL